MVIKYICDICNHQVDRPVDLKKVTLTAWYKDNTHENPDRSINSVVFDACQKCVTEIEPYLKEGIEAVMDSAIHEMKLSLVPKKLGEKPE